MDVAAADRVVGNLLSRKKRRAPVAPVARLADALRISAGRLVVDKTGLAGSYHVTLNYDMMAARRPPSVTPPPDAAPAVFTAIQEQLGLKLEAARVPMPVMLVDRIERPVED